MMPKNSYLARANAMAELERIIHEKRVSPDILNLINMELSTYSVSDDTSRALLSAKREIEIKSLIPGKQVTGSGKYRPLLASGFREYPDMFFR